LKDEKTGYEVMTPLPPAGTEAGTMARSQPGNFEMPTDDKISKEAMAAANKYMESLASEDSKPEDVINKIEGQLEGITIKLTTGMKVFAESFQSPTVTIKGSLGTIVGTIDSLPLPGRSLKQTFDSKGIGEVKSIELVNDKKIANPWLISAFHVRSGFGNPWVEMAPEGRVGLVDQNFWLDGSDGKEGPYYKLMREAKYTLLPTGSVKLVFVREFVKQEPVCASIKCMSRSAKSVQRYCLKDTKCDGFTYTSGLKEGGYGCLKQRCKGRGADGDKREIKDVSQSDYFAKSGQEMAKLIKVQKARLDAATEKKKATKTAAEMAKEKKKEVELEQKDFKKEAFKKDPVDSQTKLPPVTTKKD